MKIIHCADLHLDAKLNSRLTAGQAEERRGELLLTFRSIVSYAQDQKIRHIIIAGDLFDRSHVSVTAGNFVRETILGAPDINFYYLPGNHDQDFVWKKTIPNLKMLGEKGQTYLLKDTSKGEFEPIAIMGKELSQEDVSKGITIPALARDRINILVLHGMLTPYHNPVVEEQIPLNNLRFRNIDYLALGHIHSHQEGRLDERGIWCYPGCPEGRGFDECGEKGFVVLDIDRQTHTLSTRFVPVAKRTYFSLETDVSECFTTSQVCEAVKNNISEAGCGKDDFLRVKLLGRVDLTFELNLPLLMQELKEYVYDLTITDQTVAGQQDEDYSMDKSLKGEFVRLVMARDDLDQRMKTEIIRCGIASLKGES